MAKLKVGMIGYGYWGNNLLRNLVSHQDCEVVGVVDTSEESQKKCLANYPNLDFYADLAAFLTAKKPDAVVIATPPHTHCEVAVQCLKAGAATLIEKPLALSTAECDEIIATAKQQNLTCMVDHTFCYSPPVENLANTINSGELGDLLYYDSVRINLGGFQPRTNVLWDLAPHDLSILDLWTGGKVPVKVNAIGKKHFGSPIENMSYVNLLYDNDFIAHLHINWAAPLKVRQIMVGGTEKMAIYDDNLPSEKIRIYDKTVQLEDKSENAFRINYRVGNMIAPVIQQKEPLYSMISEFFNAIKEQRPAKTSAESGRRVVKILEAISTSLEMEGQPVELSSDLNKVA